MLKTKMFKTLAAVSVFAASMGANAALLDGQTVNFTYLFPEQNQTYQDLGNAVVGAGVEFTNFNYFNLDVADKSITAQNFSFDATWSWTNFNGFVVRDVNNAVNFTSVAVNALTNMAGLDSSRISFDAHNIFVNWEGLSFNTNTLVKLDINNAPVSVPEPTGLGLAGLGLVALMLRRRQKAA